MRPADQPALDKFQQVIKAKVTWISYRTLPYRQHSPAMLRQPATGLSIPSTIAPKFSQPKLAVTLGDMGSRTITVAVPETAVDKNNSPVFGEYEIRRTLEGPDMQPVTESLREDKPTQPYFQLSVLRFELRHVGHSKPPLNIAHYQYPAELPVVRV
ncbi:hypothetical protein RJ45_05680 [Photobacterium gaetbulicola]|uniref:Uncharacterized protein n=1 Tax=Photobacterium gaetbulicola TaxID=1295392 RepID=A0A0B9H0T6_9GAMM|nr:hypothetical protein RJ45_05680 [Photobacterium gaetbulicola]